MESRTGGIKKVVILLSLATGIFWNAIGQEQKFPSSIYSGKQGSFHVQGVAVDKKNGYVYFSFTDRLIKTDLTGKLVGSVGGFIGHLGDLDISDEGYIYASLEYKNDAIGKGIKKGLGLESQHEDGFYITIFDGAKITRPDMNAADEDLFRAVYVKEAVDDYSATVKYENAQKPHRFGCSGIDGLTLAPAIGAPNSKKRYLYVAYGIYGDTSRNDNDHQIILKYDLGDLNQHARRLNQDELHHFGPRNPMDKYFVYTGNTRYGIQNLAYDSHSGNLFAAVYKGTKNKFPNYDLFVIDAKIAPRQATISSGERDIKVKTLTLWSADKTNTKPEMKGYHFPWGATGLFPLGNGAFYISHNSKVASIQEQTTIYKYKWTGREDIPFILQQ